MADRDGGITEDLAEALRADQRSRWLRGERATVEDYLARQSGLNAEGVLDLIYREYVLREGLGEKPAAVDYLRRFPEYDIQLRRLFDLDEALLAESRPESVQTTTPYAGPRPVGPPTAIGKYVVVAPLDSGGQALVYRAAHPTLGVEVVVKLGRAPLSAEAGALDRLQAEGRILAELNHPNLARVLDLDVHEGRPFLVMEYIRGRNLEQYAAEEKPSPARAAAVAAQVARGLAFAHRRGVLHLDVKPRNVVIDETGRPRLIDFGLARLRHAWTDDVPEPGTVSGTAAFMAPEQARGETDRVGKRTDVFGLGGLLYYLLTGSPPYRGAGFREVLDAARKGAWDRERLAAAKAPRRLQAACERALATDPDARYADADDMAADLEAFVRAAGRPTRRFALAGLAGAALAAGGVAWWVWGGTRPKTEGHPPADPTPETLPSPRLKASVWRNGRFHDLLDSTPLKTGDEMRLEIEAPPDMYAALFLFNSEGVLKPLAQKSPSDRDRVLRYPPGESATTVLTGPPGAEFVLACGRRAGPITEEELRAAWGEDGAWPALPGDAVLCLDREHVWEAQAGRDFGPTRSHADLEAEVLHRMEALRGRLRGSFDFVSGTAFAHVD